MTIRKIAVTTTSFAKYAEEPLQLLKAGGFEPVLNPYGRKLTGREVVDICRDAVGIIAGTEDLGADVLERLFSSSGLRVISRVGTGLDNVDLKAAERLGIKVFNTPQWPVLAVSELTVGLVLALLRKIARMDCALKAGKWDKLMGNLLFGRKAGIVGFGRIGKRVAKMLSALGAVVAFSDPLDPLDRVDSADSEDFSRMQLNELLSWADIITIHVSASKENPLFIGDDEFRLMKKGACIVNVARGGLLDEGALYAALKEGKLSGAALDVFQEEPYRGNLVELQNVILTPHIGSYALEARTGMEMDAVKNLIEGLVDCEKQTDGISR